MGKQPRLCYLRNEATSFYLCRESDSILLLVETPPLVQVTLWRYTQDGRLMSDQVHGKVLTVDGGSLVVSDTIGPTPPSQQWTMERNGDSTRIVNAGTGLCLAAGAAEGEAYGVALVPPGDDPACSWMVLPMNPLEEILAQPAESFPAFTGKQLELYGKLNESLGVADLRSEYANLAAYLPTLGREVRQFEPPQGYESCWPALKAQLTSEIDAAESVRNLFSCYESYQHSLDPLLSATLNLLISDARVPEGRALTGVATVVAMGMAEWIIRSIPEVGRTAQSLMMTAIAAMRAAGSRYATPFQAACSELWSELRNSFLEELSRLGEVEQEILQDYGKSQAVQKRTLAPPPDTLAWPADDAQILDAAVTGFTLSAMKILLPSKYQIYVELGSNEDPVSGIPDWAQWVLYDQAAGCFVKRWIASSEHWNEHPSKAALQTDVLAHMPDPTHFYNQDGWPFAAVLVNYPNPPGFSRYGADATTVTVTNMTPNVLLLAVSPDSSTTINGALDQTLYPYKSVRIAAAGAQASDDIGLAVTVADPNQGGSTVVAFSVSMPAPVVEGRTPTVSNLTWSGGYSVAAPITNQGAFWDDYPGSAQVTIYD